MDNILSAEIWIQLNNKLYLGRDIQGWLNRKSLHFVWVCHYISGDVNYSMCCPRSVEKARQVAMCLTIVWELVSTGSLMIGKDRQCSYLLGVFSVELEKQIVFPVLEKARKVAIDLGSYHPLVNMHVPSMA